MFPLYAIVDTGVCAARGLDPRAIADAFLRGGGRKIDAWYATLAVTEVPFDNEADAFRNINTRAELDNSAQQESNIR